jgi:hypothetical protein
MIIKGMTKTIQKKLDKQGIKPTANCFIDLYDEPEGHKDAITRFKSANDAQKNLEQLVADGDCIPSLVILNKTVVKELQFITNWTMTGKFDGKTNIYLATIRF